MAPVPDAQDVFSVLVVDGEENVVDLMYEAERKYVREVLQALGGNKQKAAEILMISRSTLYSLLSDERAVNAAERC